MDSDQSKRTLRLIEFQIKLQTSGPDMVLTSTVATVSSSWIIQEIVLRITAKDWTADWSLVTPRTRILAARPSSCGRSRPLDCAMSCPNT